jgi:Ca2+-binding RTX toxin-like protein
MKNLIPATESHVVPAMRPRAWALAVSAVVIVAAAALVEQGQAAPSRNDRASYRTDDATFKEPKLRHGVLSIRGTRADDRIALRLQAGQSGVLQVDVGDDGSADFSFVRAGIASIVVGARGGDDHVRIDEANGVFTDAIPTTLDGGIGDDTLAGGSGAETLRGGLGNDSIDGNRGNDVAFMGLGDDTFVWDPGDGSDVVEGELGDDTLLFNGGGGTVADQVDVSANGSRLRFLRNPANITMDTAGVERVVFNALGGADVVIVNDLTGTDVRRVVVDEGTPAGSSGGDGQIDRVVVNGTVGEDTIYVSGGPGNVSVAGLSAHVAVLNAEPTDQLAVDGLAGDDVIDAFGLGAGAIALTLEGEAGDDILVGSAGNDTMLGGDGDDVLIGGPGQDALDGGPGDNIVVQD